MFVTKRSQKSTSTLLFALTLKHLCIFFVCVCVCIWSVFIEAVYGVKYIKAWIKFEWKYRSGRFILSDCPYNVHLLSLCTCIVKITQNRSDLISGAWSVETERTPVLVLFSFMHFEFGGKQCMVEFSPQKIQTLNNPLLFLWAKKKGRS